MAVTRACPRASAAENPMLHVQGLLTIRKADQFMRISNTEYSRNENFDLTRMFNKQCFESDSKQCFVIRIQLFRERLSEKVHATIPKGILGFHSREKAEI